MSLLAPLPPPDLPQSTTTTDIDTLRAKLVQLIDSLSTLLTQLHYLSLSTPQPTSLAPGILPWTDLLNRYNLLLSHLTSIGGIISSIGDPREKERKGKERGRDPRRERWDASVVVPAVEVEENKDWIVGMLLRTKQTPQVEAHLADLLASLPPAFTDPTTSSEALAKHVKLTTMAAGKIAALREGMDGEEWDWKGRVEVDEEEEEDEEDEGGAITVEKKAATTTTTTGRKWTVQEVATYQRTGKLPS